MDPHMNFNWQCPPRHIKTMLSISGVVRSENVRKLEHKCIITEVPDCFDYIRFNHLY